MTSALAHERTPLQGSGSGAGRRRPLSWPRIKRQLIPWFFVLPGLVLAVLFKFHPAVDGIWMSFQKVQPFLGNEWIGLQNYADVLGDQRFIDAMEHTVLLAVGQTTGAVLLAFCLALLMEGASRPLRWARTAVFLPVVTALAIIGEVWRILLFPSESGFANSVLSLFGLPTQQFLSDPSQALWWVMMVGIWTAAPYNMIIIMAGLVGIDRSLYEAAAMDGITTRQRIWYIVLPALRPAISVVLTLAAIRSLRIFTEVYVLTGGGPAGATEVWMTRTFSLGFDSNNLGVASAASVLLLLVTLALTVATRAITHRKETS
ncbi:carbohydrate ABC transporter permease [Ruania rhizosphaerae]|uniref:carbohydrate ABC transporter permease n=1 Tax=Ruania rhizosphaerae TaxID=1840413 RepID=UPI001356B891|nr:sugar ABC transporter permease [Ruania rhizosphaerae]